MDIESIYKDVSLDDLRTAEPSEDDNIRNYIRHIIQEGLFTDKRQLFDRLDDLEYEFESDNYQQIVKDVIAEHRAEERTWAKYTDCDILFVIVKEAGKIFPTLYHNFGSYSRPSDVLDDLGDRYPKFVWGSEKGDSTVIYIHTDYRDGVNNEPLHVEIFNGETEERIKIRDYICDRLEEMKRYHIIRDKKEEGGLDGIKIHRFKWQFRYPPGFFD